jgi:hypothetical protein
MAWENRGNQRYFYQSKRVGSRVVKEYVGRAGEILELANEEMRARKETEREALRAEANDQAELEAIITPLNDLADAAAESTLHFLGYHRPKRGPWRKRRVQAREVGQDNPSDPPGSGGEAGGTA